MKFLMTISTLIALSCAGAFASETSKAVGKDYENFRQEMSAKLEATETKLASLKAQAQAQGHAAKEKTVQSLEATRDRLKAELAEASEQSESKWKSFKKSFAKSVDRLNSKIQEAAE